MIRPRWDYNVHHAETGAEVWTEDLADALAFWLAHPGASLVRYPVRWRVEDGREVAETDTGAPEVMLTPEDGQGVEAGARNYRAEAEG